MTIRSDLYRALLGTIWERAVLTRLLSSLLMLLIGLLGLYCTADISLNQRGWQTLTAHFFIEQYGCQFIKRLPQVLPLCCALCTLRIFALMRTSGELVALNSSGVSLRRLSAPFLRFGLIGCLWGAGAFEWLYPQVAQHLRAFEQSANSKSQSPHILMLPTSAQKSCSCLVYASYQPSDHSESSGVFRRGFFRDDLGVWIYFDAMQFFERFAHIRRAIAVDLNAQPVKAQRHRNLVVKHQFDLAALSRRAIPAEDLGLAQLRHAAQQQPLNAIARAYFHYRLQQLASPLWGVLAALFFALRFRADRFGLLVSASLVSGIVLEATSRVILILSGYHLLLPTWIWAPFALPLVIWVKWLYTR